MGSSTTVAASRLYCLMSKKAAKSNIRRSKTAWIQTTDYIHLYIYYILGMMLPCWLQPFMNCMEPTQRHEMLGRYPVVFTAADRDQLSVGGLRRAD